MSAFPTTAADFEKLVDESLARTGPNDPDKVDEEHLAMVVGGRIEELTPDEQDQILNQIASMPWLADLTMELSSEAIEADQRRRTAGQTWYNNRSLRIGVVSVWAVAASLTIGLGVWRMIDPPAYGAGRLQTYSVDDHQAAPSDQRRAADAGRSWVSVHARDVALGTVVALVLFTTVPMAAWVFRSPRRD